MNRQQLIALDWDEMSTVQRQGKLVELEAACKAEATAQGLDVIPAEITLKEYFCEGVYAREITIPADTTLVGEIHKYPQLNIVSKGSIVVVTDEGKRQINAPCTFISPAGVKRAGYTLTETVWTVLHAHESEDSTEIKSDVIVTSYAELEGHLNVLDSSGDCRGNSSNTLHNRPKEASGKIS